MATAGEASHLIPELIINGSGVRMGVGREMEGGGMIVSEGKT